MYAKVFKNHEATVNAWITRHRNNSYNKGMVGAFAKTVSQPGAVGLSEARDHGQPDGFKIRSDAIKARAAANAAKINTYNSSADVVEKNNVPAGPARQRVNNYIAMANASGVGLTNVDSGHFSGNVSRDVVRAYHTSIQNDGWQFHQDLGDETPGEAFFYHPDSPRATLVTNHDGHGKPDNAKVNFSVRLLMSSKKSDFERAVGA